MRRILVLFLAVAAIAFAQTPTVTAVVNNASFGLQLCPGLQVTIYGSNFGTDSTKISFSVGGQAGFVLPNTALGTQFAGQLPFNVPAGATTLTATVNGTASAPFNITLSAVSPFFFTQNGGGYGPADVAENSTGKLVTLSAPAIPGDNLIGIAAGLGQTSPPSPIGPVTGVNSLPTLPTVTVGGMNAVVSFAGTTQGTVGDGLYQVDFAVPQGLQGTLPLIISADGVSSTSITSPNVVNAGLGGVTIPIAGVSSVVNSGSFAQPGTASPGSIFTVFANSIGTSANVLSGLFPATVSNGVQVTFTAGGNTTSAPLFAVVGAPGSGNPQQINLQIPSSLPTSGKVNVQLQTPTTNYPFYTLNMVPANPGFFRITDPKNASLINVVAQFTNTAWLVLPTSTTTNFGLSACTATTGAASVCGQPANIGDTLTLYATGLGLATPGGDPNGTPLATGQIPPLSGNPLYETPTIPVVVIGGQPAKVLFSGLSPGSAGEYEVIVTIPAGVTSGDQIPVSLSILGATDSSATISIQPASSITPP